MEKDTPGNKKTQMTTLYQINLKTKSDTSDKKGHFILIRGSMHQEDTIAIKVCVPNKSSKIHGVKTDKIFKLKGEIVQN